MSFPVAGGAVAVGVNLPAGSCGADTPPATISLTSSNASLLFGGVIQTWNDSRLLADNPGLTNCSVAVTRFARSDGSGTTTIFKNYLNHADGATALCDATTWAGRTGQNGSNFPSGAGCSSVTYVSGNPAVVDATAGTAGGLGYGDLSDWRTRQPSVVLSGLRNSDNSAFVSPLSAQGSNCSFAGSLLPAGSDNGAVSMVGNAWASDATPNRSDVTYLGTGYPACGFTFALVRPGLSAGAGTGAVARLTSNQRRTLYSYFLYELSPAAQTALANNYYAPVPSSFLASIRRGFVANF
jgi:ABC-type phosphate transport system substrate-binding protein